MGSHGGTVNLLQYLRSRSNVDCDSLDLQLAKDLGPFEDCTSNQADSYLELLVPHRIDILKSSAKLGRQLLSEYPGVEYEELAVEIAVRGTCQKAASVLYMPFTEDRQMVQLSQTLARLVKGNIHVMSNPTLESTTRIVENSQRIASLCQRLDPDFDMTRLCVKVVATWEGLQACRKLSGLGIQTLATTLFTIEQAVLAAEAGCAYIAPFVHELKAFFDDSHNDGGPNLELCVDAQKYYKQHGYNTKILAAGLLNVEEAKKLAGVNHMTIAIDLLYTLSKTDASTEDARAMSLFIDAPENEQAVERISFIENESKFAEAFEKSYNGKGTWKTKQAIDIFSEYQMKALSLMRENDPGKP